MAQHSARRWSSSGGACTLGRRLLDCISIVALSSHAELHIVRRGRSSRRCGLLLLRRLLLLCVLHQRPQQLLQRRWRQRYQLLLLRLLLLLGHLLLQQLLPYLLQLLHVLLMVQCLLLLLMLCRRPLLPALLGTHGHSPRCVRQLACRPVSLAVQAVQHFCAQGQHPSRLRVAIQQGKTLVQGLRGGRVMSDQGIGK